MPYPRLNHVARKYGQIFLIFGGFSCINSKDF